MPLISVVIINYNTFDLTCACIKSVFEQTKGVKYEVIVVDNASSERDAQEFKNIFPDITLIKSKENLGFAKGNNLGISKAKGDYILLLNSDAELLNDAITIASQPFVHSNKLAVVTGKLLYPDGQIQHQCGRFPSVKLQIVEIFRLQKLLSEKRRGRLLLGTFFNYEEPVYPDWVWGTFFLIKRSVIDQMPGKKLPDDFFMYSEDLQWCFLIREMGYNIYYNPQAVVLHHFSQSTRKNKAIAQNLMILQNEDRFLRANYGKLHTKTLYFFKALNLFLLSLRDSKNKSLVHIYTRLLIGREINKG